MDVTKRTPKTSSKPVSPSATEEAAVAPDPQTAAEQEQPLPRGVRTRASLKTYGPIGVCYAPPADQ